MKAKYALLMAVAALAASGVYYTVSRSPVGDARLTQGALGKRSLEGSAVQVTTGGYDNARTNAHPAPRPSTAEPDRTFDGVRKHPPQTAPAKVTCVPDNCARWRLWQGLWLS
jgi:hypothetical protein